MTKVISLKKTEPISEPESSSTKDRLLHVAKELFAQKGFHGTSTREITQRAGTNLSSLYFHWQSKENLYLAVYRQLFQELAALAQQVVDLLEEGLRSHKPLEDVIEPLTEAIYPTEVLSWLVRETGILTLEEAHFRLSGLMAWAAGFKDRGTLREGMAADIVIYDLNTVQSLPSEIAYDLPANEWRRVQKAEGYRHILVNGVETFQDGQCTGATPGALLRNGQAV